MSAVHREQGYVQRLRDLIRAACFAGSTKGGTGYCPSYSVSASVGDFWQKTGPVSLGVLGTGLGARMLKVPNGASVSLGFTGTGLDVFLTTGENSALAYAVDNGAAVMLDQRQTTGLRSGVVLPIRGLCDGPHTITISGCALGNAYVEGAAVYRGDESSGVRVFESGHSGWMAENFTSSDRWHGSFQAVPSPKLVTICLGANEYTLGRTSAQYGRGLDALLTTLETLLAGKACSLMVISPHARMPLSGRAPQSVYETMAASVAATHGAGYVRMSGPIGPVADAIAAGLLQTGQGIHPLASGHNVYAETIANAVLGVTP
jgi:hypothetical protein